MNEIQDITSGEGILKDYYDKNPMAEALRRKRDKLSETKLGTKPEGEEHGQ